MAKLIWLWKNFAKIQCQLFLKECGVKMIQKLSSKENSTIITKIYCAKSRKFLIAPSGKNEVFCQKWILTTGSAVMQFRHVTD